MLEHTIKTLRITNYLLIALIAAAILLLTRTIISVSFTKNADHSAAVQSKASRSKLTKKSLMLYADILEKNAFGHTMKLTPLSALGETISESATLTDLVLIGTVVESKKSGFAIFRNNAGASAGEEDFFSILAITYLIMEN